MSETWRIFAAEPVRSEPKIQTSFRSRAMRRRLEKSIIRAHRRLPGRACGVSLAYRVAARLG
jgi:hypothetical protein